MQIPIRKINLLLVCVSTLLATGGCLVSDGGRYHDRGYGHRDAIIVGPPVLEVRPPEVIVR